MTSSRQSTDSLRAKVRHSINKVRDQRRVSMDVPERFQGEDNEEDATGIAEDNPGFAQQSLYGLIGATHSKSGLHLQGHFHPDSGSESGGETETEGSGRPDKIPSTAAGQSSDSRSNLDEQRRSPNPESSRHRKNKSEGKGLRSFLRPIRERSDSQPPDIMTHSGFLPAREKATREPERPASAGGMRSDAPLLDRKLHARARAEMDASTTSTSSRRGKDGSSSESTKTKAPGVDLPVAVAEIFGFGEPEEIIAEHPCWYLQSVLLQGYLYITKKHVCFYAYMQKKGHATIKSGQLAKQGKRNPRYRRYWFALKGDVLSYYTNAADPYFPSGTVDLRYGVSADLVPEKGHDKSKDSALFTVTTDNRTYHFRADSATSAKEWVKQLQKVIFRSHNDGDSIKISLPLANVVDVESSPLNDMAETIRLRVIDNDQTYSVDEYFFTFFNHGKDALHLLHVLTTDNENRKAPLDIADDDRSTHSPSSGFRRAPSAERSPRMSLGAIHPIQESVRSTLSPLPANRASPRISGEYRRSSGEVSRSSVDLARASSDRGRHTLTGGGLLGVHRSRRTSKSPLSPSYESAESFHSTSERDQSSPSTPGAGTIDMSASQMLTGDNAFREPTLHMPQPRRTFSGSTVERLRRESQRRSPSRTSDEERIRVQPPSLTAAEDPPSSGRGHFIAKKDSKKLLPAAVVPAASRPKRTILATPLQYAYGLADHMRSQGKRGLSYLGSSPKDYYTKFSGAMAGGKRHYSEADGLAPESHIEDPEDDLDTVEHERRFQQHFALPESERLLAVYYCSLHRVLPLYGKAYVGTRNFCFRSLLYGTRTKMVIPFKNILNLEKEKGFRWGYPGMVVVIRGHEELFFDFSSNGLRDDCVVTVLRTLEAVRALQESVILTPHEKKDADAAAAENQLLSGVRKDLHADRDADPSEILSRIESGTPMIFDDPNASILDFKPTKSMRITCLTIGSRGDIQPYIALCKGLLADGQHPRIATHREFQGWVEKHGIEFAPVEGDPAELMRVCVENGMFTPRFLYQATSQFRDWFDGLLTSSYEACKGSDLIIESPSAMAGIHIAEALSIPYFRAFTMPWTRTRAYPHAFAVPSHKQGGAYNYMSQINSWRRKHLGLKPTSLEKLQPNKVPFLYNFSPSVVVPPLDFSDWVRVTGYWFLDEGTAWTPPADLQAFIDKARADKQKLVYIGFGSVTVSDPRELTQQVVDAVLKADVRCILSKGWSDHFDKKDASVPEVPLPPSVFQIRSAPHDWLFQQIDAAVHHGGAGTTGASLRAGVPTIIKPFFGDQYFFATRVEDLGVGIHLRKITVNALGKALWIATHDDRMRGKARLLGEQIRNEDGVATAIMAVYRDLDYARTLIKKREVKIEGGGEVEDTEEAWTFVENDSDGDVARLGEPEVVWPASSSRAQGSWGGGGAYGKRTSLGSMVLRGGQRTG
ncbi:Sterol 3-beta-glucosyltransferase [Friedmanniomyces endolithicus]|uniref:Sterol 3-beta-glucosyltransferase n=1 Tax=Friedmanniomyces endolithicus TaxID=329885 RepID=A0AAN6F719_9PEZI|nr:Sterol 3-beta-glucosyltransferase [Friedmanniomyces endolithicus]